MTKIVLESYDKELHDQRDRKECRDKGLRATAKTITDTSGQNISRGGVWLKL